MPARLRLEPLPFIPDKEPRFVLSIPFSNAPLIHVTNPFPLPRLTATNSEQDIARLLLERSPSPSANRLDAYELDHHLRHEPMSLGRSPNPSAKQSDAYGLDRHQRHELQPPERSPSPSTDKPNAYGLDHHLRREPPAGVEDLPLKRPRPRSPSPIPSSSMHDSPSASGESTAIHVNRKGKSRQSPDKEIHSRRSALGGKSRKQRISDTIDPLYASPKQKKIYDWGTFTWYDAQGHEPLLTPPRLPANHKIILHHGDMMVYKLLDNSATQVWLWDEKCGGRNRDNGFWYPIKEGESHDLGGRIYTFEFGKNFSPRWTSRSTIERRAQRRVRRVFID